MFRTHSGARGATRPTSTVADRIVGFMSAWLWVVLQFPRFDGAGAPRPTKRFRVPTLCGMAARGRHPTVERGSSTFALEAAKHQQRGQEQRPDRPRTAAATTTTME